MKIARIGVEEGKLVLRGFDDPRMAVPDERYVIVCVKIRSAGLIVEILHPAAHNFQRVLIRDGQISSKERAAPREGLRGIRFFSRKSIGRNSQQEIGVR